ncbi:MAG: biopolymer transporter ExbD, partial [Candidatus Nealsonbacteria bacterium]|nr:biopolymer transporter ExbD [Candidatus Nealsonbacteria bacterium]
PYHREGRERLDVKMTPMIDVIFLLLIFFVCTASFRAAEEVLPAQMPTSGTIAADVEIPENVDDLGEIVVKILWRRVDGKWNPRWEIDGRRYEDLADVADVLRAIREVKADLPVILDVEPPVPMEHVIDVHDLCLRVGLEQIQFAASPQK